MRIDVWLQHPTRRFLSSDMFESLLRWTGGQIPDEDPPIEMTIDSMDAAGVDVGLLTAWRGPHGQDLISNDQVAEGGRRYPTRFAGLAAVDLDQEADPLSALASALASRGPVLIHASIALHEQVLPMVPPGAANKEMIGG